MADRTTTDAAGGRTVLLGFLWLGWVLLTPAVLLWSELRTWTLYREPVPPEVERQSFLWAMAGVVLAVGLPLLGLCLTAGTGRRVSAAAFAVALVAGLGAAVPVLELHREHLPGRSVLVDPGGRACQEHSGGDTRCPGG
jgi:hypothetical protein